MLGALVRISVLTSGLLLATMVSSGAQSASPAAPATTPDAVIQAVSYNAIPAGARFETQINDDSELNQETLSLVNQTLAGRGYGVDTGAPLVMVVDTDLVRGQKQDDPFGQSTSERNEGSSRLFSSSQNSLLNPEQPIASSDRIFRINLAVYDRASGLYVWRGSAVRSNSDLDVSKASNQMVSELVGYLGRSVQPPPTH